MPDRGRRPSVPICIATDCAGPRGAVWSHCALPVVGVHPPRPALARVGVLVHGCSTSCCISSRDGLMYSRELAMWAPFLLCVPLSVPPHAPHLFCEGGSICSARSRAHVSTADAAALANGCGTWGGMRMLPASLCCTCCRSRKMGVTHGVALRVTLTVEQLST